ALLLLLSHVASSISSQSRSDGTQSGLAGRYIHLHGRLARSLAGAGVRARALAAQRQTTAMTDAAIAAEVHQSLDVHGDFAAQIAFDRQLADLRAQRCNL